MAEPPTVALRIDGSLLVVPDKVKLPPRCVHTNQPTEERDYRHFRLMVRDDSLLVVMVLLGPFFFMGRLFSDRPMCRLMAAVSPGVRRRYALFNFLGGLMIALTPIAFLTLIAAGFRSYAVVVGMLVCAPIVIIAGAWLLLAKPLACVRQRDGKYWIQGFSEDYLDGLVGLAAQ